MYIEKIVDHETGKEITKPYSDAQIKEAEQYQKEILATEAVLAARDKSRISALAKLAALGLTEDEIAAL